MALVILTFLAPWRNVGFAAWATLWIFCVAPLAKGQALVSLLSFLSYFKTYSAWPSLVIGVGPGQLRKKLQTSLSPSWGLSGVLESFGIWLMIFDDGLNHSKIIPMVWTTLRSSQCPHIDWRRVQKGPKLKKEKKPKMFWPQTKDLSHEKSQIQCFYCWFWPLLLQNPWHINIKHWIEWIINNFALWLQDALPEDISSCACNWSPNSLQEHPGHLRLGRSLAGLDCREVGRGVSFQETQKMALDSKYSLQRRWCCWKCFLSI